MLESRFTGKDLGQATKALSFMQPQSHEVVASTPVETTILHDPPQPIPQSLRPTPTQLSFTTPGAGPSSHDIGMAMGIVMPSSAILPHPPQPGPLLMSSSVSAPASHLPSPVSATSRGDWMRDEPFAGSQYPHYAYGQHMQNVSTRGDNSLPPRPIYGNDNHGRGSMRGRDDRYPTRGGRGRGFPGRGRGFRGYNNPRAYNPHSGSPNPPFPYTGTSSVPQSASAVYFPDPPAMHLQPYPYFSGTPPQGYAPFHMPSAVNDSNSTHVGPPSPTPLTRLPYQIDNLRFKLLGQIEYYFSHENVAKDVYLRERMDKMGWVPLNVLQSFPRIQNLRVSDDVVRETLQQWSQFVEVRYNHVRMAHGAWQKYVMPTAPETVVPEIQEWYPVPTNGYPGLMGHPPFYTQYPMPPYPYYGAAQPVNPSITSNGIAEHILRRPEEKIGNGTTVMESGTSAGGSIHSTPDKIDREDLETSEDDVDFVIGDPAPMVRSTNGRTESR
ncbi:hypothetical protein FRC17_003492 [Serendipita sp. 399]|nr:hypothetical protein FRC17_003492 [Serendipita sp. 399]